MPTAPWGITVCWEFAYKNTQKKPGASHDPPSYRFRLESGPKRGARCAREKKNKAKGLTVVAKNGAAEGREKMTNI
jgi:hypothetical protein